MSFFLLHISIDSLLCTDKLCYITEFLCLFFLKDCQFSSGKQVNWWLISLILSSFVFRIFYGEFTVDMSYPTHKLWCSWGPSWFSDEFSKVFPLWLVGSPTFLRIRQPSRSSFSSQPASICFLLGLAKSHPVHA